MDKNLVITICGVILNAVVAFVVVSNKIGKYQNKVDNLEKQSDKNEKGLQDVRDKAIACETALKEREPLTRRKSPVELTGRGQKILEESNGMKFVDENYLELKNLVEASNPATSYDIQELSRQIIDDLKNDSRLNPIKDYLFKEGLELDDIVVVLGIYLRNKILIEKGITTDDIDKYDKNAKAK